MPGGSWLWVGVAALASFAALMVAISVAGGRGEATPPIGVFAAAGLVVALVAAPTVALACRATGATSRIAIAMAAAFVAIAVVKFSFGAWALYDANQTHTIETFSGPELVVVAIAGGVCLLYGVVLWLLAAFIERLTTGHARAVPVTVGAVAGVLVLGGAAAAGGFLLSSGSSALYLDFVFSSAAAALVALSLLFAIVAMSTAFRSAAWRTKVTGDITMYGSLFWIALLFIVLFHVLWIVFMLALIAIWPLKTVTPK